MEHLPHDVVLDILSRLPITTLMQSKCVCRAWRSIIQSSLLANKHLSHMTENDPGIIFQSHWPIQNQYYFVDFAAYTEGNKILKKISVSTEHANLVGSCNGLLCFCNSSQIHICNPLTKDAIELPKLLRDPGEVGILGFGFSPTTKEYKLVEIVYQRRRPVYQRRRPIFSTHLAASNSFQSEVRILTLGGSRWRSLGMVPYRFIRQPSQVMVCGRLHWIFQPAKYKMENQIISFELTAEQFQEVPKPDCGSLDRCFYELMVLQGHLSAAASKAIGGLEIWVMKEYNMKDSWIKEFNIASFLPKELQHINASTRFPRSFFRAICGFKSGKILLEHRSKALVLYDPVHETFEDLTFEGAPNWFKMVVHVGSLVGI
ncbi:F-box protein At3g07870-like isoform X2 [Durio zibethinus]|nr:F-box protein At3g07870-like isoform X2 [Durio zibethinus]XP_022758956.1 F-box protein At3g07870-like isoform X2 [Durio zibethinus]XP_022758957.1 F-box protein At3g07870-like isoform X2 [Durio zibethinus]XP_022758958.1 F-box protein At3g07870-like isoform X2 [Durio zibethinus]XP_022758959.1 F-box protein At3g07870-like isoform X2 [Durio zibethinus]XP_022758960.1 F-box protein At3g07870-like isoform X2 [Durio zibethinus]